MDGGRIVAAEPGMDAGGEPMRAEPEFLFIEGTWRMSCCYKDEARSAGDAVPPSGGTTRLTQATSVCLSALNLSRRGRFYERCCALIRADFFVLKTQEASTRFWCTGFVEIGFLRYSFVSCIFSPGFRL